MALASLQGLTCLLVCMSSVHAIMVKFGTREGPIEPAAPTAPPPAPRVLRSPAPVWESRDGDTPDPNANWRPPLFVPQPRFTQIYIAPPPQQISNARDFVNAYASPQPRPLPARPVQNLFTPENIVAQLSSQHLPGVGLRYFVPVYVAPVAPQATASEQRANEVETNEVDDVGADASELKWKLEKAAATRRTRQSMEGVQRTPFHYVYEWPQYVPRRQ